MGNAEDHDLLLRIDEKLNTMTAALVALESRVTALERQADRASGALAGGRAVWGIIAALPVGLLAYLFGVKQ